MATSQPSPSQGAPRLRRPPAANSGSDKRSRILAASLKLFAHEPFQQVTMDRVAELARVAKGTLYLYFNSKDDLYLGILSDAMEAGARNFQAAIDGRFDVRQRLQQAIAMTIEFYHSRRDLLRLLAASEPRLAALRNRVVDGWRERGVEFFASLIEEGIAAGVLRPTDPRLATLAIVGAIRSALLYYGPRRPVAELGPELARIVVEGLAARPRARAAGSNP